MAGLRTIANRAGIGRCSGAGPHWPASPAIAGCTQLDPLEMAHAAVVVGARSGDFERWDHRSQITSEGLELGEFGLGLGENTVRAPGLPSHE